MATISGRIIFDRNRSATIDAGDSGIANVPVVLQNAVTNVGLVVLTDANGSKMALKLGGYENINLLREESYKILKERGRTRLSVKLTNKRRRMADEGVCKSKRDKLNKLDVIGDDSRLLEIYLAVVKDMAIKYGVKVN